MVGAVDPLKDIEHYAQVMKAPRIRESAARLAEQARSDGWSHEDYLAAVLSREVTARESSGTQIRIQSAGFPTRKSLEKFNFDYQPSLSREMVAYLGTGVFLTQARNVVLLGSPGTGKTHLAIGLGDQSGSVRTSGGVRYRGRLGGQTQGRHTGGELPAELARLRQVGLVVVDEVGYNPFEQDAANLFFQLVSSRYEHASLILTSNLPFGRWGDVFDDQAVAAAMIDRIVYHGRGFDVERGELPTEETPGSIRCRP